MGRLSTPYKMAGLKLDSFYDTSAGPTDGGSNYGLSGLTNGWRNNALGYVSPKLAGVVTVNAVAFINEDDNNTTDANAENEYNVGATYSKNGITASVQHLTEREATRLAVGYKASVYSIGLSYEDVDPSGPGNGHTNTYLAGTYKIAPKTTLAASFGNVDDNGTGASDSAGDGFTVGVFHKIASKTTVTALYSEVDYDSNAVGDRDVFAVGLIQKF